MALTQVPLTGVPTSQNTAVQLRTLGASQAFHVFLALSLNFVDPLFLFSLLSLDRGLPGSIELQSKLHLEENIGG